MEAFTEQPSIWSCHLRTFVCTISKKEPLAISCLQSRCGLQFVLKCVVRVDFRVFRKKKSRFLCDVHIVEALNETVDDSGSDGDVSEVDYIAHSIQVCDHIGLE
jgi:hypothetical protein